MMDSIFDFYLDREPDDAGRRLNDLLNSAFVVAPVILAVSQLGIPAVLAGKALTTAEIAAEAGTDPGATARLLRAGAAAGILTADADGRFTLTDMGNWLRPDVSGLGDLTEFWREPQAVAMAGLGEHVRTGRTIDPAAPGGVWDFYGAHPDLAQRFARGMGFVTSRLLAALSEAGYRPPAAERIVDVGGSRGTLLAWLLQVVPGARGVLFDLPGSLATAPDYLASQGVADRTEVVPGSFLENVPEGDLHVISNVLHNWDDDSVRRIAANCARAAKPGGSLVIICFSVTSESAVGHLMDMLMMVMFGSGERTREEFQALIEPAGYTFAREVPVPQGGSPTPPWTVLEFRRDA